MTECRLTHTITDVVGLSLGVKNSHSDGDNNPMLEKFSSHESRVQTCILHVNRVDCLGNVVQTKPKLPPHNFTSSSEQATRKP